MNSEDHLSSNMEKFINKAQSSLLSAEEKKNRLEAIEQFIADHPITHAEKTLGEKPVVSPYAGIFYKIEERGNIFFVSAINTSYRYAQAIIIPIPPTIIQGWIDFQQHLS